MNCSRIFFRLPPPPVFSHVTQPAVIEFFNNGRNYYYLTKNGDGEFDDVKNKFFSIGVWSDRFKSWLNTNLEHSMDGEYLRILKRIFYEQCQKDQVIDERIICPKEVKQSKKTEEMPRFIMALA